MEPFLTGSRDLQVAVRTYPEWQMSAIEAPARSGDGIYSYDQKYLAWGGEVSSGRELPANVDDDTLEKGIVDCRGGSRRSPACGGSPGSTSWRRTASCLVNEVNTIPGSMAAYLWIDPPIERARLFRDMLAEAASGPTRVFSTAGSDGTALRSAGIDCFETWLSSRGVLPGR